VFKFNHLSSAAGAPCNQLLPIAAVMDKIYPEVKKKRKETGRYKSEIKSDSRFIQKM
jgi:hypothetical protein